jgi:hypothetical protein
MKTRAEAAQYLRNHGLHAEERDWVLGKTVAVASGATEVGGIKGFARAMYIVPKEHAWSCFELDRPRPEDELQTSLEEACARAVRILTTASDHARDQAQ